MSEEGSSVILPPRTYVRLAGRSGTQQEPTTGRGTSMTKRFDEEVLVERDAGMPAAFEWRGRRYEVADVIGKWRIEGQWWSDGRDREYWRGGGPGGGGWGTSFSIPTARRGNGRRGG